MRSIFAMLMAGMLCAGCKSISTDPPPISIEQADAKLAAADYSGAQALYAGFANANPASPQADRARATQTALHLLLAAQTEIDRVKRNDEAPRLRRELADRLNELDRLKAEVAKLRGDIERLRSIDLQTLPTRKK